MPHPPMTNERTTMQNSPSSDLLQSIHSPEDVKAMPADKLEALAAEIRNTLIHTLSETGGPPFRFKFSDITAMPIAFGLAETIVSICCDESSGKCCEFSFNCKKFLKYMKLPSLRGMPKR